MRRGEGTGLYAPAAPNAYLTALPAGGDAGRLRAGAEGGARRDGQRAVRRPVALAGPGHGGVKEAPRQLGAGLPLAQRLPAALLPPDGPLPRAASTLSSPAASATGCTWAAWLGTSSWWIGPTGTGSAASSRRRGGSCHTLSSGTRNGCSWPRGATRSCTTCTPNSTGMAPPDKRDFDSVDIHRFTLGGAAVAAGADYAVPLPPRAPIQAAIAKGGNHLYQAGRPRQPLRSRDRQPRRGAGDPGPAVPAALQHARAPPPTRRRGHAGDGQALAVQPARGPEGSFPK